MTFMTALYRDSRGEECIQFESTGSFLKTSIRGIPCSGNDFDSLSPLQATDLFTLCGGDLCCCSFSVRIPVRLIAPDGLRIAHFVAEIILGSPTDISGIDREDIAVNLTQPEFSIRSRGDSGWFEDELLSIASQLPAGFRFENCFTCGLSDYSPYGHGAFGHLACFRGVAPAYRQVFSKGGIFQIWSRLTEYVQETHYCPCYESRPKGRGYRG